MSFLSTDVGTVVGEGEEGGLAFLSNDDPSPFTFVCLLLILPWLALTVSIIS